MVEALRTQRTYALIGHGGTGKTSVAEMILYAAGAISRMGKIEEGTSALDYEPEEIKRHGSTQPGFARYEWQKNTHYLIDVPGDTNFIGDLSYMMTATDGVIFTIDAVDGVKPLSKRIWDDLKKFELPTMIFINKLDRDRADFNAAFQSVKDTLGIKPFLLYLPIGQQQDFKGVVDILQNKAFFFDDAGGFKEGPIPADVRGEVDALREKMVEEIAVCDETLMEKYFTNGALEPEEATNALRQAVLCGELIPVLVGSALQGMGGRHLLSAIQDYMPSPLDHKIWSGEEGAERASSPEEPTAAFVFKTLADPFSGQLSVMRVLSGRLAPDMTLANPLQDGKERIGQVLNLLGKTQAQSKEAVGPGAIVAVAKLKNTCTGDTLCDEKSSFILEKPKLPPMLITYAVAPAEKGEEDKVYAAVNKLLDEDVNLSLSRDEETGDILLSGMGQLHIETAIEKAKRRFKVNIVLETPKIPYRETIKGRTEVQGRHKKQSGGRGQFGDCWVRFEPRPRGEGYEFVDAIVGGVIPRQFIPAVDKGIQEAARRGVLAGFPMVDFKATLYDGSYHTVDSSEMAFKVAGSLAFKKGMEQAKPILLEPIMLVTVYAPDAFMGDIIGDLSSRRGKIQGSDSSSGITEIRATVPMSEIMKYAPDLRAMTGGQGTFTMEFSHYEECPPPIAEKVVKEHRKEE